MHFCKLFRSFSSEFACGCICASENYTFEHYKLTWKRQKPLEHYIQATSLMFYDSNVAVD